MCNAESDNAHLATPAAAARRPPTPPAAHLGGCLQAQIFTCDFTIQDKGVSSFACNGTAARIHVERLWVWSICSPQPHLQCR
jgi:hypothetical protein